MHRFLLTTALFLPITAFAAGAPDPTPPTPTETTMECTDGQVWSETTMETAAEMGTVTRTAGYPPCWRPSRRYTPYATRWSATRSC